MKGIIGAGLLIAVMAGTAGAQELQLSLHDAIRAAVENNLDVKAELYTAASAEADVQRSVGIYNPVLALLGQYQDSRVTSTNTFLTQTSGVNSQRSLDFNAGVTQLLPTGASVGAFFDNSWIRNNFRSTVAGVSPINDYFDSTLGIRLTQPLLRNFGRETTEFSINVARFNKTGFLEQFRAKLMDVVTQVRSQYFQLYATRENLKVRRASLELAQRILADTQARVRAGVLPAMEILNAQFGVAQQQKNLIDAERAVKDQVDLLRLLMQLPDTSDIIPVDTPFQEAYPLDEPKLVARAFTDRPELRQLRVSLQINEIESRAARNQTLPQLDLLANAAFSGTAQDYNRDLEKIGSLQDPNWLVGLQFSYPIGNDTAKNDYIKSKLRTGQTQTRLKAGEEAVRNDVRNAMRAVESGFLQLDVTARGRAYAEEVLQAYIKKQSVGLATAKDVQDELTNLVTAQGAQIQAVADYNKAITALWKATGEVLGREGVTLDEKEADRLYEKNR